MKRQFIFVIVLILCILFSGCSGIATNHSDGNEVEVGKSEAEIDSDLEPENHEPKKVVTEKEVVFINYKTGIVVDNKIEYTNVIKLNQFVADEETLYACGVSFGYPNSSDLTRTEGESDNAYRIRQKVYWVEQAVEVFLERGLMVLQEYPYCLYNNEELYNLRDDYQVYSKKFVEADFVVVGTYTQLMELFDGTKEESPWHEFVAIMAPRPDLLEVLDEYIPEVDYTTSDSESAWVISYAKDLPDILGNEYCTITVPVITMD